MGPRDHLPRLLGSYLRSTTYGVISVQVFQLHTRIDRHGSTRVDTTKIRGNRHGDGIAWDDYF